MAKRGEQLGVRCTVFNEWYQEQQVSHLQSYPNTVHVTNHLLQYSVSNF